MTATTHTNNATKTIRFGAMAALAALLTAGSVTELESQDLPRLGETVRVTVAGGEAFSGWLVEVGADDFRILNDNGSILVANSDVESLDRWTGGERKGWTGAAIGGGIGVVAGIVAAAGYAASTCNNPPAFAGGGSGPGYDPEAPDLNDPDLAYAPVETGTCSTGAGDMVGLAASTGLVFAVIGYFIGQTQVSDSWQSVDVDHARANLHLYAGPEGSVGATFRIAMGGKAPRR
jgi:hypothetical protein